MIQFLDGQLVRLSSGQKFWAVFDSEYIAVLGEPPVESRRPALQCRTSEIERFGIAKGAEVTVGTDAYRIERHEPDGTGNGMSVLLMKRA